MATAPHARFLILPKMPSSRPSLLLVLVLLCSACARTNAAWTEDLSSPDPFVRGVAAIGLGLQAPLDCGAAIPVLLRTIDRSDVGLEAQAADVLAHVGQYHIPQLLTNLVDDELMSVDRRGTIKNALVLAGPEACDQIIACLRAGGSHLVGDLGDVLLSIGTPSVPAIARMLTEEPDPRLQNFAAYLLGRLGPGARAALPALAEAAQSATDAGVRDAARIALLKIQPR